MLHRFQDAASASDDLASFRMGPSVSKGHRDAVPPSIPWSGAAEPPGEMVHMRPSPPLLIRPAEQASPCTKERARGIAPPPVWARVDLQRAPPLA